MVNETSDIPERLPFGLLFGASIAAVPTRWWTYVERVTGNSTQTDIAHKAGIDKSHLSMWKARGVLPNAAFALKFARSYGRNVLEALAEAEIITDDEANVHEVRVGLDDFTIEQMLEEILDRLKSRSADDD